MTSFGVLFIGVTNSFLRMFTQTLLCTSLSLYTVVSEGHTAITEMTSGRPLSLLDELLGLEVLPEVEHLPGGEGEQTAHGED